jgi:hypothetical protein
MTHTSILDTNWNGFFKFCGWISLILVVYSLVTMVILFVLGAPPETAVEAFEMLEGNRFIALLRLDILTVSVYMPLFYPLLLGLYAALKKTHPVPAAIAALLGFAGVTLFLATPSVFSWLALSDRFAAATSEAQRTLLLAAGEAILASDMWHGTGATIGGILIQVSTTLLSIVMLSSNAFGKGTAYLGIVTHGLDLARLLVSFFLPVVGFILISIAGPLYLIWFPLLARDFFRLGRGVSSEA